MAGGLPPFDKTPQSLVFGMVCLFFTHKSCPCILAACAEVVKAAGACIDDGVHLWGDFEWHRSSIASVQAATKGRRCDPHVKAFCLEGALSQGLATTIGQAARGMASVSPSQAVHWREVELASFRAAMHLSFFEVQNFSIAFDCARIGRPAKELLLLAVSAPEEDRHGVAPPQVLLGIAWVSWPPLGVPDPSPEVDCRRGLSPFQPPPPPPTPPFPALLGCAWRGVRARQNHGVLECHPAEKT